MGEEGAGVVVEEQEDVSSYRGTAIMAPDVEGEGTLQRDKGVCLG